MTVDDVIGLDEDLAEEIEQEYDPLADDAFDDDDEVDFPVAHGGGSETDGPHVAPTPEHDPRPAAERIAELFDEMPARRKTLLAILAYCMQQQPVGDVTAYIGELKQRDHSVYSANDFCKLLQRAGALERVDADGELYQEVDLQPKTVVVDGVEYLEPDTPPPAFWHTTAAGAQCVAQDDPAARIRQTLDEELQYLPIYQQILEMCSQEGGASAREMAKQIDQDPLLKNPRYYSSRFVERLNIAGALQWEGKTWHVTDAGLETLAQL